MKPVRIFSSMLVILLLAASVHAQTVKEVNIEFDINEEGDIRQTTNFHFTDAFRGPLNYTLDDQVTDVKVMEGQERIEHRLTQHGGLYLLEMNLEEAKEELTLEYTKQDGIFRSGNINLFYTELNFPRGVAMNYTAKIPSGYVIKDYRPGDSKLTTDGQRMKVSWKGSDVTGKVFSIKYERSEPESIWLLIAVFLGMMVIYLYFHYQKKSREDFLRGFREDERKVINYLEEHKECKQSDMRDDLGLSKVKVSRIVKKLEEKDLVEKETHGRTNMLKWVK